MLISTVSHGFVLWGCIINDGKTFIFSYKSHMGYKCIKFFMFCGKLSNIIAQLFGYPSIGRYKLRGSGVIVCCRFYLKKGTSCD